MCRSSTEQGHAWQALPLLPQHRSRGSEGGQRKGGASLPSLRVSRSGAGRGLREDRLGAAASPRPSSAALSHRCACPLYGARPRSCHSLRGRRGAAVDARRAGHQRLHVPAASLPGGGGEEREGAWPVLVTGKRAAAFSPARGCPALSHAFPAISSSTSGPVRVTSLSADGWALAPPLLLSLSQRRYASWDRWTSAPGFPAVTHCACAMLWRMRSTSN